MSGRRAGRLAGLALAGLVGAAQLAGCADDQARPVDAPPAAADTYPFFAQVRSDTLGYLCGGALVDPSWVLTAARCATTGLTVVIGRGTLDDQTRGEVRPVTEVRLHPSWTAATVGFDVALLRLATPSTVTPVALADDVPPGTVVRAVGHALIEGASNSSQLRQVELRLATAAALAGDYGADFDQEAMIGAGVVPGEQPFCAGDRGSPLLVADGHGYRLAGVASRERGCPPLSRPGLFASTVAGPVRAWLEAQVRRELGGFVLADQPTAAEYRPVTSGGSDTVSRTGAGAYTVSFAGLGHGVSDGVAQATAYGPGDAVCQVAGAEPVGAAQHVRVRCTGQGGAPADSAFSASYARPVDAGPYAAALVAGSELTASYNSGGGTNTVRRSGPADHTVSLPSVVSDRGAVTVTPYGDRPAACAVSSPGGAEPVRVRCSSPFSPGVAVDTAFGLSYTDGPPPVPLTGGRWAWVRTSADGPPAGFSSAGGQNTVTRTAAGTYLVRLGRMGQERGIVHVTTAGQRTARCTPGDQRTAGDAVELTVRCAGDAAFSLLFQSR